MEDLLRGRYPQDESGRELCERRSIRTNAHLTSAASPIVLLAEIPMNDYRLRRAETTAFRLIPSWVEKLLHEDRKPKGELTPTVQAFGESSLNVKHSAKRLKLHANPVYFRLNRVQEIAGVDPRSLGGLTAILTALRLLAREPPPGFRVRARDARSDRTARLWHPRDQRVVRALPPAHA